VLDQRLFIALECGAHLTHHGVKISCQAPAF
jgi:hypothetical protein